MDGYSILVETHAPDDAGEMGDVGVQAVDDLTDALAARSAVVTYSPTGWAVRLSIDAEAEVQALARGHDITLTQAVRAGLPAWPVVRVEAVREDVLDEELSTPNLPDLVSGPEAGRILGVNRQRVHQLAHEHPDFPKPLYTLAVGSLWDRPAVEKFADTWQRKSGRPRKAS